MQYVTRRGRRHHTEQAKHVSTTDERITTQAAPSHESPTSGCNKRPDRTGQQATPAPLRQVANYLATTGYAVTPCARCSALLIGPAKSHLSLGTEAFCARCARHSPRCNSVELPKPIDHSGSIAASEDDARQRHPWDPIARD